MIQVTGAIAWYLFLATVIAVFQRRTKFLTELNIFTAFLFCLLLRHGVTVPLDHNINGSVAGIDVSPQAMTRFYVSLVLMYLGLLAGGAVNRRLFSDVSGPADSQWRDVGRRQSAGVDVGMALLVIGGGTMLVMVTKLQTGFSLTEFFSGSLRAEEYAALRTSFGEATHYTANIWQRLGSIVFSGLLPSFVYILYFLKNRGLMWKAGFWFTLAVGVVAGIDTLQKTPAALLLIGLGLAYCLKRGWTRVSLIRFPVWIMACAVIGVAFPFLYQIQYSTLSYAEALQSTLYRLSSEYDRSLQLYFEIYPDVHPFMWGTSSSLTNALLGLNIPPEALPERFIPLYYLGPLYPNTWNACFIGVAWADFGYLGVIVESALLGLLLQWYAHWFARSRKTAVVMGTQVGLMMAATRVSEAALSASLLTFGLGSAFLMYLVIRTKRQARVARLPRRLEIVSTAGHAVKSLSKLTIPPAR